MPPIFVGFAPMFSALAVAFAVCLVVIASLLFFVLVVLLVVLFPFGRYDKKKGRTVWARPLFVCCGLAICL